MQLLKRARTLLSFLVAPWKKRRQEWQEWERRIQDVISSPDNTKVPRVKAAGSVQDGWLTMHNGLVVLVDGYYGRGITRLLKANKGCHEPQEEYVFAEVLRRLGNKPTMIECGAYWAFYSMWFLQTHRKGKAFMIEPDPVNLEVGRKNFSKNGFSGHFEQAGLGETDGIDAVIGRIVSIPSFMAAQGLDSADILHMDIQGAEQSALQGALPLLREQRFNYIFVSTHSAKLHEGCISQLMSTGYAVDASIPPSQSHSVDGFIAARSPLHDVRPLPKPQAKMSDSSP
jgi:hypothetical protein